MTDFHSTLRQLLSLSSCCRIALEATTELAAVRRLKHCQLLIKYKSSGFGGLVISMLASGNRVCARAFA
jgi:hypothetical protein